MAVRYFLMAAEAARSRDLPGQAQTSSRVNVPWNREGLFMALSKVDSSTCESEEKSLGVSTFIEVARQPRPSVLALCPAFPVTAS